MRARRVKLQSRKISYRTANGSLQIKTRMATRAMLLPLPELITDLSFNNYPVLWTLLYLNFELSKNEIYYAYAPRRQLFKLRYAFGNIAICLLRALCRQYSYCEARNLWIFLFPNCVEGFYCYYLDLNEFSPPSGRLLKMAVIPTQRLYCINIRKLKYVYHSSSCN